MARVIRLRMGATQADAVQMHCTDDAHAGAFPGAVEGVTLVVALERVTDCCEWLMNAANSLDDDAQQADRDVEDRRTAGQWRDALHALYCRLGHAAYVARAATPQP